MKQLVEKLKEIEKSTSEEKGTYNLFALFLREDKEDLWDLLVSASWIQNDKSKAIKYLAPIVQDKLDSDEIKKISRIVLIDSSNPALEAVQKAMNVEHGMAEIVNSVFFGLKIKHAYLITSKK